MIFYTHGHQPSMSMVAQRVLSISFISKVGKYFPDEIFVIIPTSLDK